MQIRAARPEDEADLVRLVAEFRVTLSGLKDHRREPDLEAAAEELSEYRQRGFPVIVAAGTGSAIHGYLVCRIDEDVLWAESLYVPPEHRRKGIGSALYGEAERLAQEIGGDAPYNWVHPNNHGVISFLGKRGYTVLNLVELRRPRPGEETSGKVPVGEHEFDY